MNHSSDLMYRALQMFGFLSPWQRIFLSASRGVDTDDHLGND